MASQQFVVLVVEDEVLIRAGLVVELAASGWRVLEAGTATEALALCHAGEPVDLLITDINLGDGTSGWDVAHTFWQRNRIPVIYTSGDPDAPERRVPASRFMAKPYDAREVSGLSIMLRRRGNLPHQDA